MKQIINSLLQNDFYKFSMGQTIFHQHNNKSTKWAFKCRNKDVKFTFEMVDEIKHQVELYCNLRFTEEELNYLLSIKWIHKDYTDFLRFWHPRMEEISIITDADCGLAVETNGTWLNTSMYETPIMAIICEVYYRMSGNYDSLFDDYKKQVTDTISFLNKTPIGNFSEFGFRRALSQDAHDYLINQLTENNVAGFLGTSNVYLARKYGVRPMGTMAHEFIMVTGQGYPEHNPAYSNKYMMDSWVKEYGILNGVALTDTITTDAFLADFQLTFATLFSGVRHDSGDPFVWGEKIINHYKNLGIDPMTKTLLFSDSLTLEKALELKKYFEGKAKVAFGIGGALASPHGNELNIVIKPIECDGFPIAKLSDSAGKNMCRDASYIEYLRRTINWRLNHNKK